MCTAEPAHHRTPLRSPPMDIQEISDRLEIEQLLARYPVAIDGKDWDLLDRVFTEDAHLDYSSTGGPDGVGDYPTMKKWLQDNLATFSMTQHLLGKSVVEVDGDKATCRTLYHNPMGYPVKPEGPGSELNIFVVGGWYDDTCVRTADGWRITRKILTHGFTRDIPS